MLFWLVILRYRYRILIVFGVFVILDSLWIVCVLVEWGDVL